MPHHQRHTPKSGAHTKSASTVPYLRFAPPVLFALTAVMVYCSILLVRHYWAPAYFAATGQPFRWGSTPSPVAPAVKLPQFATTESISQTQLAPGSNFSLIITATSDQTTPVFIRAYINNAAPPNKQIWRSPEDKITEFPTGQAVTTTYPVHLPDTLKPGTYQVSYLLTSKDEQTDYLQKPNFAEFTVK